MPGDTGANPKPLNEQSLGLHPEQAVGGSPVGLEFGLCQEGGSSPSRHASCGGTALLGSVTVPFSLFCSLSLAGCPDQL